MTAPEHPNAFVRIIRKAPDSVGFSKGYNLVLYLIFAGALLGFCLARISYLDINGIFLSHAAPGEAYWYRKSWYNIGISIHLFCVVPAGILAVLQFTPVVRHKLLLLHRINGYILMFLLLVGNIGALMIVRRAFGGTLATQSAVGVLAIATTGSIALAYIHIKRLRTEQHRAWMLRCWAYAGTIITTRIILFISAIIIGHVGPYYIAMPCEQIAGSGGNATMYIACREDPQGHAAVHADFATPKGIEEVAAAFEMSFGMALWLSITLHAAGVEVYLHLTPKETERLGTVSCERQLQRGLALPDHVSATVNQLGNGEDTKAPTVIAKPVPITT